MRLGGFINKIRTVQGWNMLGPEDVKHLAAVWHEQLERKGVPEVLFDELINRAVDHRLGFLRRGEQAPTISIELILAMFLEYKSDVRERLAQAERSHLLEDRHLQRVRHDVGDRRRENQSVGIANQYRRREERFTTFEEVLEDAERRATASAEELAKWEAKAEPLQIK